MNTNVHRDPERRRAGLYADARGITSMDAIDKLRITRLFARIYDLKKKGYEIEGQNRTKKDADGRTIRWKEYWLA